MKIVINEQHGGFNISAKALKILIERRAKCVEITPEVEYYDTEDVEAHLKEERGQSWGSLYEDHDMGDGYIKRGTLGDLPLFKDGVVYDFDDDYPDRKNRADQDLIAVIGELGEGADGFCASLKIVEIPDGVEYCIEEYDGLEWIAEQHRTWR